MKRQENILLKSDIEASQIVTKDQNPEALWKETKMVLLEAAKYTVIHIYMQQQKRKTWYLTRDLT